MELVLTTQELEPLPKRRLLVAPTQPGGLLNSNYKNIVRCNYNTTKSTSIFGIKQRVKSRRYQFASSIDTILKLSVFLIALAFIF